MIMADEPDVVSSLNDSSFQSTENIFEEIPIN
jgi:hypothetical protein